MGLKKPKPKGGVWLAGETAKWVLGFVGRMFGTLIMVGIITGCIVVCVLAVYILQIMQENDEIEIESFPLGYSTFLYYYDKDGNPQEMQRMYNPDSNRVWVDYENIPEHTKQALVAVEDKRFFEHSGVDWRRTFGAFVGQYIPIAGTTSGGGSTITQQLVKNLTGDKEVRVDRKVREIFRALELSKRYTPDQILETYLNVVPFGNGTNGIEAAANSYFGKEAKDLTLAESAAIVGITKYPTLYNPFLNPEENKKRREDVLYFMLEQERITQEEYDAALKEKLNFKTAENIERTEEVWSYFTDYVVTQVIHDLMEKNGYTLLKATKEFYEGGYSVYTTVDMEIQSWLEQVYLNTELFPPLNNPEYPQSACVITDINGKILGMVGGIGKKEESRILNRATDSVRQPGSSIKPLATYALAFDNNRVTWSTMVDDHPINKAEPGKPEDLWPDNHYGRYDGLITIDRAIAYSVNTVAVKVLGSVGIDASFNFLKNDLNFHSIVDRQVTDTGVQSDRLIAPLGIGAMTYGVTPLEMAGGYQIFANGGNFTTPYAYTKVVDQEGRTVLEPDTTPRQVIGEDTSVVLNKLLQRVVVGGWGTAGSANLGATMPTAGKTGTSEWDIDQWFIGITPYHVCQIWMGFDEQAEMKVNANTGVRQLVRNTIRYNNYAPPILFKTIMQPISEKLDPIPFMESDQVVSRTFCQITGNLATESCPATASGWYKTSRIPPTCSGDHTISLPPGEDDEGGGIVARPVIPEGIRPIPIAAER